MYGVNGVLFLGLLFETFSEPQKTWLLGNFQKDASQPFFLALTFLLNVFALLNQHLESRIGYTPLTRRSGVNSLAEICSRSRLEGQGWQQRI